MGSILSKEEGFIGWLWGDRVADTAESSASPLACQHLMFIALGFVLALLKTFFPLPYCFWLLERGKVCDARFSHHLYLRTVPDAL